MATTSSKALGDKLRTEYLEKVKNFFGGEGEEVLITGSGEVTLPVVDAEGNERWVQIVVKIPKGSQDGEPFDGYSLAEDFRMKQDEKKAKAEENARKKAEKIERDKASRAAKAAEKAAAKERAKKEN